MKVLQAVAAVAAVAFVAMAAVAFADEKKIEKGDVPKAVLDAVSKKYPKAVMKEFSKETEDEKTTYEVEIEDGKRKIDVECDEKGKILCEEETIEKDALPDKVKKGLADSKYGSWEVKKAEKIVKEEKNDDPSYELIVVTKEGDKKFEIVFDKNGKLTKEEEKKVKKPKEGEKKGEKKDEDEDD
jgi:hypothetical protein